jgi:Protein kinase domain
MKIDFMYKSKSNLVDSSSTPFAKIVLLPSKLTESSDSIKRKEAITWMILCVAFVSSKFIRQFIWLFLLLGFIWLYITAAAQVEEFGISSLFRYLFVTKLVYASVFVTGISLFFGGFFSSISISPRIENPMPDTVYLCEDGFKFWAWSQLIPWEDVLYADTKELLYRGRLRTTVLELAVKKARLPLWQYLKQQLTIDGTTRAFHFLDPASNRLPESHENERCIRIPLEMFAFEHDRQTFLASLRAHIAPEIYHCEVESDASGIAADGFTRLWLQDLRSEGKSDLTRVLKVGRELKDGAYQVTGVLGYGGFSVVYSANARDKFSQLEDSTNVAIKELVVNSGGTRASKEAIFKNVLSEAELLKKLDHPNIVKYLDLFAENGKVYVVLEALVAPNLRTLVAETGGWSEDLILSAAIECCSILSYLHNRPVPIIHRDFTPDNLILDVETDVIKLIDFNVAEEANAQISETIVGKQSFMAPEQWCGQFTTSGDLYQLGCTLYFLATASEPEALTQADPQVSSLSNGLRGIIRKLTEREPNNRYSSADELAQDLKVLQNSKEHLPASVVPLKTNSASRELTR